MGTRTIEVVDSHTGGEPTRVVVAGGPDLGSGSLALRRDRFRDDFDRFRSAIVNEPRGSDVIVGALLVPPEDRTCAAGVVFFNNVGCIGMCGHGTIGVVATLAHLGRLASGRHRIETPVGVVAVDLAANGEVSVENVASYRTHEAVRVDVPGVGAVEGDIAWGGNWFFLVADHGQELVLDRVEALTDYCWALRCALNAQGHEAVDHVELFGAPGAPEANSRSFVLCPGKAYDRSPCGTGTSAKLACLAADGRLAEGAHWIQESIIGSTFRASYRWLDHERARIVPTVTGRAHVNAHATLILDDDDPYCYGIREP
jgi:4-hydroxyproline epimerase